ncbi:uncharacterized protein LOC135116089 [Scylla paramamosain]|uniref:uncharacterized protein LOC135116089 n=1 Tax=Scylla paramamosain TaxID=85552 RepID=UPI003083745F
MVDKELKVGAATSSSPSVTPVSLVTVDHVRAALTSDKGAAAQLTAWEVVDFTKKGDNYACLVTSVEVKYEIDGKSSEVVYVIKINSGKTFGGENMFDLFFEKECKFFLDIAPQINSILREIGHTEINVPKCFHASLEKGKEVIFLEDLRARGYKMADRKQGLDEAHTILVLRELARLHAASLLLQNKTPDDDLGEKYPYLKIGMAYLMKNYNSMFKVMKDNVIFGKTIIKKVGGYERVAAWIDMIIPNLVDIFEQLECGEPKVVCHGDCWNNNLLFRYSETGRPEEVMLLDMQLTDHSVPAADLNYLLYTSMAGDVRKPNIEAFLGSYYTTFKDIMEAGGQTVPFTQAQLLKDFRDRNLAGSLFAIMFVPVMLSETEGAVDSSKDDEEDLEETLRKTREKSLEMLDTNPLVKSRFLSVFDEMMELGIIVATFKGHAHHRSLLMPVTLTTPLALHHSHQGAAFRIAPASRMADKEPKIGAATSSSPSVTPESLVTENHVRTALMSDKGAAAQLTAWKVVDFTKKGDNYACLVTSVEVKYEIDGKSSEVVYVVKLNSGKTIGGDSLIHIVFEKESSFFLDIAPQINSVLKEIGHTEINVPKCFHASLEEGKEVIFLEDLRARGYKMADRRRGLDKAHTTLVLRELARLHAASLLLQNKTPYKAIGEKYSHLKIGIFYFIKNYKAMLNVMKDSVAFSQTIIKTVEGYERVNAWMDTIIPKLVDIFEQLEYGEPKVVCHGDCWINNLLFRYSKTGHPEDVMLLDLQLTNYSAPAADLNYLLYTSMSGDVRKPNIEVFMGSYYTTFKDIMEAGGQTVPFTQAQLLKDFREKNLIGSMFAILSAPVMFLETEESVDSSKECNEDLVETFREAREKSLEMLNKDPLMKSRFLSVFDEMMELGIIP